MKIQITTLQNPGTPSTFRWAFLTEKDEEIATGTEVILEYAHLAARDWVVGKRVQITCDVHWSDSMSREHVTPGPCFGLVASIDFREAVTILDIRLEGGGDFLYERGADGDILHFVDVTKPPRTVFSPEPPDQKGWWWMSLLGSRPSIDEDVVWVQQNPRGERAGEWQFHSPWSKPEFVSDFPLTEWCGPLVVPPYTKR